MKKFSQFIAEEYEIILGANEFLKSLLEEDIHYGDCNNNPCSCDLCKLEMFLKEYREYCRENKYIKH